MNRSIEQSLLSLLPTHNSAPPPALVELASSFLAQSRHRASTLKAEEEIARAYVCAHIACNRLKISLNLPPINEHGAPIAPRLYKRLYNHLDRVLEVSTPGRIRTSGSKRGLDGSPAGRTLPSRTTPSKEKSLSQYRSPSTTTPSKARGRAANTPPTGRDETALPRWVQPTLRFLCKELGNPTLGPIVLAGMESVTVPHGRRSQEPWVNANLTGLLGTIYLYVWTSAETLADRGTGKEKIDAARYARMRREVLEALGGARKTVVVRGAEGGDEADNAAWAEWRETTARDLDRTVTLLNRHGCFDSDWANSIRDLVTRQQGLEDGGDREDEDEDGQDGHLPTVRIGKADTMSQERYDFLTERKRRDYKLWKEGILNRIKELETDSPDAMQLDA